MTYFHTSTDRTLGTNAAARRRVTIGTYFAVWKQRRELASMDASRLKDIGVSPAQAAREAARPFWDLP